MTPPDPEETIPVVDLNVTLIDDKLKYDDTVIGRVDHSGEAPVIVINLGWCREAGVHVTVLDDPERDHHRNGKVLER